MIITVAHTKGGVGKSLIAWNLAIALGAKVIDLDFQQTLLFANAIREQNGLKPIDVQQIETLEDFFRFYENQNEKSRVVIDVGGFDSDLTRMALYVADIVLTPASERLTELAGLMKFDEIVTQVSQNVDVEITSHVVVNNVSPNAKDFSIIEAFVEEKNNFRLLNSILHQRADYYKSLAEGKSVMELKNSKAKKEFKAFVKEIKKVIKHGEKKD
ncbi:ParA family protein [Hydrogenimonas cancrithermarum]|uniref:Chromosome partitioning protein ParA n=1 Tax=Hydrogenimonas cancrithermarum TaxID=2993563 RepID=A0ABM8FNM0_9BACT|nr:ParA family protein [Hydrogenimonas cancrithermarum]BDY13972.1 chromosome partitioning protein ParA [Hydrogenimonas cancrithermarum]